MAAVLGISGLYHDAAAALVVDGVVIAAIQEERLSRIKNDLSLPRRAVAACLRQGGIRPEQLDAVVFYENPFRKLERVLGWLLRSYPASARHFPRALSAQLGDKLWVLDQVAELLGVARARVRGASHHLSHAASAFLVSPFAEAAILTVDGVGEEVTTALYRGRGGRIEPLLSLPYPHSLGLLYAALTAYLGFEVNEGEHKVMGLSALGTARYREPFEKLIQLHPDGSFDLSARYFAYEAGGELGYSPALERLLGPARKPGTPWCLETSEEDRRYADVAATLQQVTEEALLSLARRAQRETGLSSLCLAGGVALNAVANRRLAREAGFERVFVQPAAGDAGGALGAALLGSMEAGDPRPAPMTHAALGESPSVDEAVALARHLGLSAERLGAPARRLAELLLKDGIVGICSGAFEWGPRALGQRSLLALPARTETRERLNRLIKQREPFRPFAPTVLEARAADFFADAPSGLTPFMTTVCQVLPEARAGLAAVTHVDGTARVQTLAPGVAPLFGAVLAELERETGVPIALNTSLNGPGEPIVAHAQDALGFLCAHAIDGLLIEDYLFRRPR
ncbi:MAG: carbamoyltransferase N-terminal domain-containing protein [Myxococcales bacterium]